MFLKKYQSLMVVGGDFEKEWVHLRKSNTEPIIRVYTEAMSAEKATALAQRFVSEINSLL